MVVLSQSATIFSGLIAELPYGGKFNNYNGVKLIQYKSTSIGRIGKSSGSGSRFGVRVGKEPYQSSFDDNWLHEPFLLTFVKEVIWGMRSLCAFLVEQPSQLKYIEWPSFTSTLKTATLSLVLVALLIVALSSIDSALSFLLAFLLRRTP